MKPLDIALVCWLVACAVASLLQLAAPGRLSAKSVWGAASAWQRENALWNLALCVGIAYVLISRDEAGKVLVAKILAVLSIFLGLNHLAATRTRRALTHVVATVANGFGLALIVWGLLSR